MKSRCIVILWLLVTLLSQATELKRDGWNLIGVCQGMNRTDINMTGIDEIQSQDGQTIYTGAFAAYSNLETLEAGYAYWVKGTAGDSFESGHAKNRLTVSLRRTGWNLLGSCENISRADINMTNFSEMQNQDGQTRYTGAFEAYSNLDGLELGVGYWVKGEMGTAFVSKRGLTLPIGFDYQTINNKGEIIETTYNGYTIKLFTDYSESPNDQANHIGIVVHVNGNSLPIMQIQESYRGHELVIGIYDANGSLVAVSDTTVVDTINPVTVVTIAFDEQGGENPCVDPIDTYPNFITAKDNALNDVSKLFNGLVVTATTNSNVNTTSTGTNAIYGVIDGNSTNALLKLNSNYVDGSLFVVKVYKEGQLVGLSDEQVFDGDGTVDFGSVDSFNCENER